MFAAVYPCGLLVEVPTQKWETRKQICSRSGKIANHEKLNPVQETMFLNQYLISFRGDAVLIDLTALCGQTSLTLTFGHV